MPVTDGQGGPVTITVGNPTLGGSPELRERPYREPRETSGPSGGGGGSSSGSDDGALILGLLIAAPVVIIGGTFYIAGKALRAWLEERRLERERRRRYEEERRRLEEEDRRRVAALREALDRQVAAGRVALYDAATFLLERLAIEALAEQPFPFAGLDLTTHYGGKFRDRENLHNQQILDAYRKLWADPPNRALLELIPPQRYKAMLAWESDFKSDFRSQCARNVARCKIGKRRVVGKKQGVGLCALIPDVARSFGLKVDSSTDERLEPEKAIGASLRMLVKYHKELSKYFAREREVPHAETFRELTVLSYNTSPYPLKEALTTAAESWKKKPSELRMDDLLRKISDREASALELAVGARKFGREATKYLDGIRLMLDKQSREKNP